MIYKCHNRLCGFLFERTTEPDACPDCGSINISEATPEEKQEYIELKKTFGVPDDQK